MTTMTTPVLRATPPQRGTLARDGTYQVPLHWRGGRSPGWLESSRKRTYSPLSSRAKRGDPVNKKALRANARRHIALDCHSRTPTFSTLIVLLRNDRGRVDIIYTLNSTLYYCHAVRDNNITLRAAHTRGNFYSANVPTDIVIRRIPLLMDFSLFTRARIISPV